MVLQCKSLQVCLLKIKNVLSMDYNKNTNIRYHISKELSRHRELEEKKNLDRLNDFAIPVFSGVSSSFFAIELQNYPLLNHMWIKLIAPIILYIFFYYLSKKVVSLCSSIRKYYGKQTKKSSNSEASRTEEDRAAKFNYEVICLVQIAYTLVKNLTDSDDVLQNKLYISDVIFYTKNALRKSNEVLFSYSVGISNYHLNINRITTTLDLVRFILQKLKDNEYFSDEVSDLIILYTNMKEPLKRLYNIDIEPIN